MFHPYLPFKRKVFFSRSPENKKSFPHIVLARMYYTPTFHIQKRKLYIAEFPAKASRLQADWIPPQVNFCG